MRRKSERNKGKSSPEKKPEKPTRKSTRRRGKRSPSTSPDRGTTPEGEAPEDSTSVSYKHTRLEKPAEAVEADTNVTSTEQLSNDDGGCVWKVARADASPGEIQKLKLCRQRNLSETSDVSLGRKRIAGIAEGGDSADERPATVEITSEMIMSPTTQDRSIDEVGSNVAAGEEVSDSKDIPPERVELSDVKQNIDQEEPGAKNEEEPGASEGGSGEHAELRKLDEMDTGDGAGEAKIDDDQEQEQHVRTPEPDPPTEADQEAGAGDEEPGKGEPEKEEPEKEQKSEDPAGPKKQGQDAEKEEPQQIEREVDEKEDNQIEEEPKERKRLAQSSDDDASPRDRRNREDRRDRHERRDRKDRRSRQDRRDRRDREDSGEGEGRDDSRDRGDREDDGDDGDDVDRGSRGRSRRKHRDKYRDSSDSEESEEEGEGTKGKGEGVVKEEGEESLVRNEESGGNREASPSWKVSPAEEAKGETLVPDVEEKKEEEKPMSIARPAKVNLKRAFTSRISTDEVKKDDAGSVNDASQDKENHVADESKSIPKRRRWGTTALSTDTGPVLSISTDSLKALVPGAKPLSITEVRLSKDDEEDRERRKEKRLIANDGEKTKGDETQNDNSKDNHIGVRRKISIVKDNSQLSPSPPVAQATSILLIKNLVRPFTLNQIKELLSRTGSIVENGFWMDRIKSKCFVEYANEDQAFETRQALHGISWPTSNPKKLQVEYALKEDMSKAKESSKDQPHSRKLEPHTGDLWQHDWGREEKSNATTKVTVVREWDLGKEDGHHLLLKDKEKERKEVDKKRRQRSRSPIIEAHLPAPARKFKKKEDEPPPAKLLDDLFRKTKSTPCIYWLPLTNEQIVVKEEMRRQHMAEHARRLEEMRRAERTRDGRRRRSPRK